MKMMLNELMVLASYLQPAASEHARQVDKVQDIINIISYVFFFLVVGLMILFCIKYRRKGKDVKTPHISHNLVLEIAWSVIPLFILMGIFVIGYKSFRTLKTPSKAAMRDVETIYITGQKYSWLASYSNGAKISSTPSLMAPTDSIKEFSIDTKTGDKIPAQVFHTDIVTEDAEAFKKIPHIVLPAGRPVRLVITATDVLHSFFIPALRVKQDAIPGQSRVLNILPEVPGTYIFQCAENCGGQHAFMIGYLRILPIDKYEEYLKGHAPATDPWTRGKQLYDQCKACHSLEEGKVIVGPSWHKLIGSTRQLGVGGSTAVVDFDYIKESLLKPDAKKAIGFESKKMSAFNFSDADISAIIEFMKSPDKAPNADKKAE